MAQVHAIRRLEQQIASNVEDANGILLLFDELRNGRDAATVAAAMQSLRRLFAHFLRDELGDSSAEIVELHEKPAKKKPGKLAEAKQQPPPTALAAYHRWLRERLGEYLSHLLSWVGPYGSEDANVQVRALRTLMEFAGVSGVCLAPEQPPLKWTSPSCGLLCHILQRLTVQPAAATAAASPAALVLAAHVKMLTALSDEYINAYDDVRYNLLRALTQLAQRARSDRATFAIGEALEAGSPLYAAASAFDASEAVAAKVVAKAAAASAAAASSMANGNGCVKAASGKNGRKGAAGAFAKANESSPKAAVAVAAPAAEAAAAAAAALPPPSRATAARAAAATKAAQAFAEGCLAVLMRTCMVEEQADLTAFFVPLRRRPDGSCPDGEGGDSGSEDDDSNDGDSGRGPPLPGEMEAKGSGKAARTAGGVPVAANGDDGGAKRKRPRGARVKLLRWHRKVFTDAWLACLALPIPGALYRQVLLFLPEHVIPFTTTPVRLADFLTESYSLGGVHSVLALDSIFLLMQEYNLDYPRFFESLYGLLTPEAFYAKYRARLFRMLDMCLSSTHLPAHMVAAFAKKMCRVALRVPPQGALFALAMARKLLLRHNECVFLVNMEETAASAAGAATGSLGADTDPFDESASLSGETHVMESSLWEAAALRRHYHPAVATLAKELTQKLPQRSGKGAKGAAAAAEPADVMANFLGRTYKGLFDQEMKQKARRTPITFAPPATLLLGSSRSGGTSSEGPAAAAAMMADAFLLA